MKILKKLNYKTLLNIVTMIILIFIPILKQSSFYLVKYRVIYNYDEVNVAIILFISIPFLFYVYIRNLMKTKRKLDIYDYLFYILVLAGVVATIFSIDIEKSLFGKVYRHEGLLTVISYYLLFITWKVEGTKEDIKRIINVIVLVTFLNAVYALLQVYTPYTFILRYTKNIKMASGLCGNPNFFGTLLTTTLSMVTTKFLIDKKFSLTQILLILLFGLSLYNSSSSGPILSFAMTIIFIFILLIIKKLLALKKILYVFITCILILISALIIFHDKIQNIDFNKCEVCVLVQKTIKGDESVIYSLSHGRLDIWKKSLEVAKDNLLTGVGYDNLFDAYYEDVCLSKISYKKINGQTIPIKTILTTVDNAHNIYIQNLVSNGLIGFIPWMALLILTFIKGLKSKNNLILILLSGFVAYSLQGIGNINVVQVTPIYYIIIGLILSSKQ